MPHLSKIWIEQCEAARAIEVEFGVPKALAYLIGEKFLNFLEAADDDAEFRAELPAFVAEIKTIFERFQLAEYLEAARQTEPFDPSVYADADEAELERRLDLRHSAADLLLVERAKDCKRPVEYGIAGPGTLGSWGRDDTSAIPGATRCPNNERTGRPEIRRRNDIGGRS